MKDLFTETCPCCGQKIPEAQEGRFDDFWNRVPNKIGKAQARKNWSKLTSQEQIEALQSAKPWFANWQKQNPSASPIHPATYLSHKRWEDEGWRPEKLATRDEKLQRIAANIKTGRDFLCRNITATAARAAIEAGLIDAQDCRKAGVVI